MAIQLIAALASQFTRYYSVSFGLFSESTSKFTLAAFPVGFLSLTEV
jgi:hypothetical protein